MAAGADQFLRPGAGRPRARGGSLLVRRPVHAPALIEAQGKALARRFLRADALLAFGPGDMARGRAVAGLAADADLAPPGRVNVPGRVVVLLQIGRMAPGALVIPVLIDARPMQGVARRELAAGVKIEPSLAALLFGPRIPGDPEGLQPPARQFDQILLERIKPESEFDLEIGELAVRPVGSNEIFAVAFEERGFDIALAEAGVVEIAQDIRRIGDLHRGGVVGFAPVLELAAVAGCAGRRADETRRVLRARRDGTEDEQQEREEKRRHANPEKGAFNRREGDSFILFRLRTLSPCRFPARYVKSAIVAKTAGFRPPPQVFPDATCLQLSSNFGPPRITT